MEAKNYYDEMSREDLLLEIETIKKLYEIEKSTVVELIRQNNELRSQPIMARPDSDSIKNNNFNNFGNNQDQDEYFNDDLENFNG